MREEDLPFRAEYAKSGRANCKGCRTPIGKDTLRMAIMIQSPFFDGKSPNWYHFACFFTKQKVKTEGDIGHFDSLRWDDQEKIRAHIVGGGGANGAPEPAAAKGKSKAKKRAAPGAAKAAKGPLEYAVEYAKSSRALCRGCEEMIIKGEVRCSKKDYDSEEGRRFQGMDLWYHPDCFVKLRNELEWFDSGAQLPGYKNLTMLDKAMIKEKIPKITPPPKVKEEVDETDGPEPKKVKVEDNGKLQEENRAMFKYRDLLKDNGLSKAELIDILEYNEQEIPVGVERILDRLTDNLVFGALAPCPKCQGQFVYRSGVGYQCQGNLTEWVKCQDIDLKPKRKKLEIPEQLKEKYPFLAKYKGKVAARTVVVKQSSQALVKDVKDEVDGGPKITRPPPPLKNMQVLVMGNTKTDKDTLKNKIIKLGGRFARTLTRQVAFVISTPDAVDTMNKKMEAVKEYDIQVMKEDILDKVKDMTPDDVYEYIKKNAICDWGSDPKSRVPEPEPGKSLIKSRSKSVYMKSVPKSMTVQLKGGAYVDPESGVEHMTHVYRNKDGDLYTAVLNLVDIQNNKNSFYKMQLLEADKGNSYWLFRAWGRVGTTIGGTLCDKKSSLKEALDLFHSLYLEKSGNKWSERRNFVKRPGLMYPVDVDYGEEMMQGKSMESDIPSSLPKPVQDLLKMMFDIDTMKQTMLEFELDLEKMPLGKISQKQMRGAYAVLTQLQEAIVAKAPVSTFLDLSNRFYTLMPHSFGVGTIPVIDTEDMIKKKLDMLDNMMELEASYKVLSAPTSADENPLDAHYKQLKADICVVDRTTEEFRHLQQYVKNTHAPTHTQYDLEIEEVFKVSRPEERKRYLPYKKKLENRQLLWHGSRVSNYAGILSQGLRIAPKEAPVTGYMFGKGVYFADCVSKSANYCCTSKANPYGLMLLCEVALGNICEKTQAEPLKKPPPGYHSVKGVGMTEPDPETVHVTPEGTVVPYGPLRTTKKKTSLLYNEYIVYETSQLEMQYLFKMRFNHKY